ncbi:Uncharacterized protein PECH_006918 [Penicillium ucsense]|uniref:Uncharacterized protein n=1 Tax=Penicillium ucsense TaxID=2839758 RepID=A0A8J8W8P0_9EURO|nr:Uncharacterized protein PECM_004598 [Penicillium ucsense]KAF7738960.1 Uncharacterized protein PECH_006918 [Penicillium ucsense]
MDDVKPTARWANRMLRPLKSVYRRLEKYHETLAIIASDSGAVDSEAKTSTETQCTSATVKAEDWEFGSDADEDDPVWIPGKKPDVRRVRHRYSTRNEGDGRKRRVRHSIHSPEVNRVLPGAINLATPVITGKRWEAPMSRRADPPVSEARSKIKRGSTVVSKHKNARLLRSAFAQRASGETVDSEFAAIVQSLEHALNNFLKNTTLDEEIEPGRPHVPHGTRSLMATALRRLPAFIQREQNIQDEHDNDADEDMCDAYFTELECFYAPHGRGWKPLRQAVRAQGLFYVSSMIRNKWLNHAIVGNMIAIYHHLHPDAGKHLLSVFLSTVTSYPYPTTLTSVLGRGPGAWDGSGDPLTLLHSSMYRGEGCDSIVFHELAKVLLRGTLPAEWMATHSWTNWMYRATMSLEMGDQNHASASRLIEAALLSAAGILPAAESNKGADLSQRRLRNPAHERQTRHSSSSSKSREVQSLRNCPVPVEDALNNQVLSLLATMCGLHITRSRHSSGFEDPWSARFGHTVSYLRVMLERATETQPLSRISCVPSYELLRRGSILLAEYLLHCNDLVLGNKLRDEATTTNAVDVYCEILAARSELIRELALFCRQVFRCFGRWAETDGSETRGMITQLVSIDSSLAVNTLLGRVAVEAAMEFAEHTGDPDDHVWAIAIQEKVISRLGEKKSQPNQREQIFPNECYRWEESIGEWITRTPAVKVNVPPLVVKGGSCLPTSGQMVNISCLTDRSSQNSDRESEAIQETPASSFTSPSSAGVKRLQEDIDSSPLQVAKRQRAAPVIINNAENNYRRRSGYGRAALGPQFPPTEQSPPRSQCRVLRERPSRLANRKNPIAAKPASEKEKVEVVIYNGHERESTHPQRCLTLSPGPDLEVVVDKRPRRAAERRRSTRSKSLIVSDRQAHQAVRRRSMVIPCTDEDSDDELSFL